MWQCNRGHEGEPAPNKDYVDICSDCPQLRCIDRGDAKLKQISPDVNTEIVNRSSFELAIANKLQMPIAEICHESICDKRSRVEKKFKAPLKFTVEAPAKNMNYLLSKKDMDEILNRAIHPKRLNLFQR